MWPSLWANRKSTKIEEQKFLRGLRAFVVQFLYYQASGALAAPVLMAGKTNSVFLFVSSFRIIGEGLTWKKLKV